MEATMLVRMRSIKKLSPHDYRLTLDVVDPEADAWDYGDVVVQVDLYDGLEQHRSAPRGILTPAFELYRLSPEEPPQAREALLLWQIGEAVDRYVRRMFEAGILCPFRPPEKEDR